MQHPTILEGLLLKGRVAVVGKQGSILEFARDRIHTMIEESRDLSKGPTTQHTGGSAPSAST